MELEVRTMEFSGKLLRRGFWIYVWDIRGSSRHLYVGRTGVSSSPHAPSPFRCMGQHLDPSLHARGNALGKRLKDRRIDPESCMFQMTAIGPIFDEQETMDDHRPLMYKTAALERALAVELKQRGYDVLGTHDCNTEPEPALFAALLSKLDASFPSLESATAQGARFQPIHLRGDGPSGSEILLRDRGRL
jgi:hypothetical protein